MWRSSAGVSKQMIRPWKVMFRGMEAREVQRVRESEDENGRVKRLLADLMLDHVATAPATGSYRV